MLDFKTELSKFKPLPEASEIDKYKDSTAEDIIDILRAVKNEK